MDSLNFKKLASDAGTMFNRAKQFTEEKLGQVEKTEFDAHFENLLQRADKTREWTEKILAQTQTVLQPNPNARMEEYLYEKMDKKKPERMNNAEWLGQHMIDAGNEFGPGTNYGGALVKCGHTQQKLGMAEREFIHSSANTFLQPLRAFLDGDMKTVQKERKILETKRLDLDAHKTRLRRAKTQSTRDQAENDLRVVQSDFDRQAEIIKLLLEGISSTHAHHLRCLHDFVEAQLTYYSQCQQYMTELQKQMGSCSLGSLYGASNHIALGTCAGGGGSCGGGGTTSPNIHVNPSSSVAHPTVVATTPVSASASGAGGSKPLRAKVLYDYAATDMHELSLVADELITVYRMPGLRPEYLLAERGTQRGNVPLSYIELLN